MKYVVFYASADDVVRRAGPHVQAHGEQLRAFHARGELLMVGTFAEVQRDGAMAIFRTREGAEEFVDGDPFVRHGVVASYEIREWNEAFG